MPAFFLRSGRGFDRAQRRHHEPLLNRLSGSTRHSPWMGRKIELHDLRQNRKLVGCAVLKAG